MKAHLTKRLVCLILAIVLCLSAAVIPALAANDTKNVKVKVQKVSNDTVPTELNPEQRRKIPSRHSRRRDRFVCPSL